MPAQYSRRELLYTFIVLSFVLLSVESIAAQPGQAGENRVIERATGNASNTNDPCFPAKRV